jgi:hypothetical protein
MAPPRRKKASPRRQPRSRASSAAIERFFADRPTARRIFVAVERAVTATGAATMRVTKAQIAFRRQRGFAWVWTPDRWLAGDIAPLVLSVALSRRDPSARWKQIVEPTPGRWMHHLELRSARAVDGDVRAWLREAWEGAQANPAR